MYEGTSAEMVYSTTATLCSYPSPSWANTTSAWTMIQGTGSIYQYAQSGEWYYSGIGGGCWRHFAEQSYSSNNYAHMNGSCVKGGEKHVARQQSVPTGSGGWAIQSWIDSTLFLQSSWDQFVVWSEPFVADYMGETHYDCSSSCGWSDVPGTTSVPVNFGGSTYPPGPMEVQDYYNNNWYDTCGYVTLYPQAATHYSTNAPHCDNTNVWTSTA